MIANLNGKVLEIDADSLVLGIGGVGLLVYAPAQTRESLKPGDVVSFYTYLVVREDALTLYGFENKEERNFFELLIAVNGVGPRLALATLSTLSTDVIRRAVFQEQPEVFNRVPGIGKKTGQKILLHLQDRIPALSDVEMAATISDIDTEIISALTALGYSVVEAQAALQSVPRDAPDDIEARLRLALRYFS